MRFISLIFLFLIVTSFAYATTEYFYSYQNGYDYCDGKNLYWCTDQIKSRIKESADRDFKFRCEMRQGKWDMWSTSCSFSCSPSYLPIEADRQYTSCTANCSSRCELP